jgi:anti-sigma factor RsiW
VVSERLQTYVRGEFPDEVADAVIARLATLDLANAEKQSLERIQAAVVLLTRRDIQLLEESVQIAERDWRDALVWSGLGHPDWPARLDAELGKEGQ